MYKFGANYPGRGAHVASATYLISPEAQGRGIGRALVEHSLAQAQDAGYRAIAVQLRGEHQCAGGGAVQAAGVRRRRHRHKQLGFVDAYVMCRHLSFQGS